jgi:hypothetical protein
MSKDLHANVKISKAMSVTAISGNGTTNGDIIDRAGYQSVVFALLSGTLTDGTYTPSITEGDAADLSDGADATDLHGTVAGATFAATADNAVKKLGYRGSKRYIRLNVTAAGVTTGGTISAIAIQGGPEIAPVA